MMLSTVGYVLNDTMMKLTAPDITLFQAVFVRGLMLTIAIGFLSWRRKAPINPFAYMDPMLWLRVGGEVIGTIFFLNALFNMPLANVTAISQVTSLVLTLVSALFFGEEVGWRRYLAIGLGFIGVLLIVRPGSDGFTYFSLLALAAVFMVVMRDLTTQRVAAHIPSIYLAYLTSFMITLMGGVGSLFTVWQVPAWATIGKLTVAGCFLFVGYLFGIMTMRVGQIGFVTLFRYTVLIWAILIGIFVFGDIPDTLTLLGCAIIAGTGIYTLYRERLVATQHAAQ